LCSNKPTRSNLAPTAKVALHSMPGCLTFPRPPFRPARLRIANPGLAASSPVEALAAKGKRQVCQVDPETLTVQLPTGRISVARDARSASEPPP
jgi:hypothetical protein